MNTKPEATCSTCPYFVASEAPDDVRRGVGNCRYNPPSPLATVVRTSPLPTAPMQHVIQGVFAPVSPDTWCGRHPDRQFTTMPWRPNIPTN